MLLNISNHPYESWGVDQLEAATVAFGNVVDYPFPVINPEWGLIDVTECAINVYKDIVENYPRDINVLIMGEFVFCFQLIIRLHEVDIPCFVATSDRISKFKFVRFRPYF